MTIEQQLETLTRKSEIEKFLKELSDKSKPLYEELRKLKLQEDKERYEEELLRIASTGERVILTGEDLENAHLLLVGTLTYRESSLNLYFNGLILEYKVIESEEEDYINFIHFEQFHGINLKDYADLKIQKDHFWIYKDFLKKIQTTNQFLTTK